MQVCYGYGRYKRNGGMIVVWKGDLFNPHHCRTYIHMHNIHYFRCIWHIYVYTSMHKQKCTLVHASVKYSVGLGTGYEIIYSGWDICVAGSFWYQSYHIRYTHLMGWSMHFAYYFNISFIPPSVQIRVCVIDRRISALSAIFSYGYVDWM